MGLIGKGTTIRKWVTALGGFGALLVGGALSVLPSLYPNQFAHHPKIVWGCLIAGVALFLLKGLSKRKDAPEVRPAQPGAQASATGNQLTVNLHTAAPAPTPATPHPHVSGMSLVPKPQFDIQLAGLRVDSKLPTVLKFVDTGGHLSLVITALNKAAAQGQQAVRAHNVFAHLTFTVEGSPRASVVNRACWVEHTSNEIPIEIGETEHILIGWPTADEWITYNNHHVEDRAAMFPVPIRQPLEKRTMNWGAGAVYIVDVKIISHDRGITNGMTFAQRQVRLEWRNTGYDAKLQD